ncbi:hypothetical protein O181_105351 [Austropuccinia psidii MF-1]|uniref:Reverse transcriptase RNase H-like domain-containing protein n=1 Tax=Austropuccinia psidii MF-1 TaxID=1389203 RepID=A0A9Q3JNX2_9BASI|nr:hypothetical protein [Austropuccinia psidii MF-1]
MLSDFVLQFKLYINGYFNQGLGEARYQRKMVYCKPREGVICLIYRQLKDSEARYGKSQTEYLCLIWDLEKLHYYLEGSVFDVYTDCTAIKYLFNKKTTNRHMLRLKIAIQEYRGHMNITYNKLKSHTNADGLSRWPLGNSKRDPSYDPEGEAKIPMENLQILGVGTREWYPRY